MKKTLLNKQNRFIVDDVSDFHSKSGTIKKDVLQNALFGDEVSNGREHFYVFKPDFIDEFSKIKRLAQIMVAKDVGFIITSTGIGKDSVVVEAGTGSGSLSVMLGRVAKKVYSFDIKENHLDVGKKNAKRLGIDNVEFSVCDVTKEIPVTDVDVVILDMLNPWDAVHSAYDALKMGGYLVTYSPSITQSKEVIENAKGFLVIKTSDILERNWIIDGKKVRPEFGKITHTGFITIMRKVR